MKKAFVVRGFLSIRIMCDLRRLSSVSAKQSSLVFLLTLGTSVDHPTQSLVQLETEEQIRKTWGQEIARNRHQRLALLQ